MNTDDDTHRLIVESVSSSSQLRRSLSPGQADEYGEYDDGVLVVASDVDADALVERYPNVHRPSDEPAQRESETVRLEADNEGVREVSDYPTNEAGEPLCVGKDDGQCSRVVDEPGSVCWQHQ